MLGEFIVGSALVMVAIFGYCWVRDPALRERIERPRHEFIRQVRQLDAAGEDGP